MSREVTLMVNSQGGRRPATWEGSVVLKQIPQQMEGREKREGLALKARVFRVPQTSPFWPFWWASWFSSWRCSWAPSPTSVCGGRRGSSHVSVESLDVSPDLTSPVACAWAPSKLSSVCVCVCVCVCVWLVEGWQWPLGPLSVLALWDSCWMPTACSPTCKCACSLSGLIE